MNGSRRTVSIPLVALSVLVLARLAGGPPTPPPGSSGTSQERRQNRENCLQADCHADLEERPALHAPVAGRLCTCCHRPLTGEEHAFELVREEDELCTFCHTFPASRTIHEPFQQRACLTCHDPHGGATRDFLVATEKAGQLCLDCHELETGTFVHPPCATGRCSSCHPAHGSAHTTLTRAAVPDLCFGCHPRLHGQLKTSRKVHDPVRDGNCLSCHESHASDHRKRLVAFHPGELYRGFSEETYELCFLCHVADRFLESASTETGFRDGSRNLHYVHVNKPRKGRSCRFCHPAHAGEGLRMLRKTVPFRNWQLPIGFEPAPDGGSCASGCHRRRGYSRGSAETTAAIQGENRDEGKEREARER